MKLINYKLRLVKAASWVIVGICSLSILSYAINSKRMATWIGDAPMAIPTAVALTIIAVCIWILADTSDQLTK